MAQWYVTTGKPATAHSTPEPAFCTNTCALSYCLVVQEINSLKCIARWLCPLQNAKL